MLAKKTNIALPASNIISDLGEIRHRKFIPPELFLEATKNWFDHPLENINGWESRDAAEHRITKVVTKIMSGELHKTVAIVGHGGTATLLKCFVKNIPPSQTEDQPSQGCYFVADWEDKKLIQDWVRY